MCTSDLCVPSMPLSFVHPKMNVSSKPLSGLSFAIGTQDTIAAACMPSSPLGSISPCYNNDDAYMHAWVHGLEWPLLFRVLYNICTCSYTYFSKF